MVKGNMGQAQNGLTPKIERFIAEYLVDLNGKQAAIRAGYSPKRAEVTASELLASRKVSEVVAAKKAEQLERADLSAARVLEELRRLAFIDLGVFYQPNGQMKALKDIPAEARACIASIETTRRNLVAGDGLMDQVLKLKVWDKLEALDKLAKHFGLLTERLKLESDGDLIRTLNGGRARAAAAKSAFLKGRRTHD